MAKVSAMSIIWHNGAFKNDSEAVFTAHDRVRLGDGVFDTVLAADGKLIHSAPHIERLLNGAGVLGIAPLPTHEQLSNAAQDLLAKNGYTDGRYAVNIIISHGPAERGLKAPENTNPQTIIRAASLPDTFPPINAIIAQSVRRNEGSPLSRIKSFNYGDNILALREAEARGANEAIMLNNQGHVTCATAGNIFAILDDALATPPLEDGVLDGITRALLIKRYNAKEKTITAQDLTRAQALYITNSIRGAMPVVTLDGRDFRAPSLNIPQYFYLE